MFTLLYENRMVKPSFLLFNDWLKEESGPHHLINNTTTKTNTEDTNNSVTETKFASKFLLQIRSKRKNRSSDSLRQPRNRAAFYANAAIGSGNVVSLNEIPPKQKAKS